MRVFIDTNVLLDVLAQRNPHCHASAEIWSLSERKELSAFISAISFNNIYYVVRKADGERKAEDVLRLLRDVFGVVAADMQILNQAMDAGMSDFEDAIQFHSAVRAKVSALITRDPGDYPRSELAIATPEEFLALWKDRSVGET